MKKILFSLLLCLALILSVGVVAYAAAGGFTMTYLPGTSDTVTNMPDADSGVGGQPYTVSDKIPQREGYEFLGWTLDYGVANTYTLTYQVTGDPTYGVPGDTATPDPVPGIRAGSNVTLANALTTAWTSLDGTDPAAVKETYKVNYLEQGTDRQLAPQKVVTDQTIGTTLTECAIAIDGYQIVMTDGVHCDKPNPNPVSAQDYYQNLTIRQSMTGKWTFTGWCSDEACTTPITEVTNITADMDVYGKWTYETIGLASNEITFYYEEMQAVKLVSYRVWYIDEDSGIMILPEVLRENIEAGTLVTEEYEDIEGYFIINPKETFTVQGDELIIFRYYRQVQ